MDDLVRERVAKAKIELEIRLRAQIEQEMKNEIESMQKREVWIIWLYAFNPPEFGNFFYLYMNMRFKVLN